MPEDDDPRSLTPEYWSRGLWDVLHAMYVTFPTADNTPSESERLEVISGIANLVLSLQYTLPCAKCRRHFAEWTQAHGLLENPVFLNSQDDFGRFLCALENDINHASTPFQEWKSQVDAKFTPQEPLVATQPVPVAATPPVVIAPGLPPAPTASAVRLPVISTLPQLPPVNGRSNRGYYRPIRVGCGSCGRR